MTNKPNFDEQAVHRYFSALCFNLAWDLIKKQDRSSSEDEKMVRLCHASLWHWTQRVDCTAKNLSIGYWQASRIYALLGQAENARHYGQLCLEASEIEGVSPFYQAYAYEALARAEAVAGNDNLVDSLIMKAQAMAKQISEAEDRQQLLADLSTIRVVS